MLDPAHDDPQLIAQVADFYGRALKQSSEALAYLRDRGVTNGDALDVFRIGYADRTLGLTLPVKQVRAGKSIRDRLQTLGLYRGSGHEHFNGCVTFPITDATGRIVDMYGRKIGTKLRKGTPLDMWLGDERRGVWNTEGLRGGEILLLPTVFDALTFWSVGYRNVTFGELTPDLTAVLTEFQVKRVLVGNEELAPPLTALGLEVFHLRFPNGMTAAEYAKGFADPARALGAIIRKAHWLGKGQAPRLVVP